MDIFFERSKDVELFPNVYFKVSFILYIDIDIDIDWLGKFI